MKKNYQKGFTLLYTSLIVSLILSISLAIISIALDQFLLSSAGRESQIAFYSADTANECAFYFVNKGSPGTNSYGFYPAISGESVNDIACNDLTAIHTGSYDFGTGHYISKYFINDGVGCDPAKPDFIIEVDRFASSTPDFYNTVVKSRGYDTCDTTKTTRVERGLQLTY